jgi:hypothetical protein
MKTWTILARAALLASELAGQGYKPESGYMPDPKTAAKIAEAVLTPVYEGKQIALDDPLPQR